MIKKLIGNIFLSVIKKRDKYLLRKFANRVKTIDLPHSHTIYNAIIGVLDKSDTNTYNAFKKIEEQRLEISKNSNILDDGSLGPAGLYDGGLTIAEANNSSKPQLACEFLGLLALHTAPKTILELGTNTGISSSYMSMLLDNSASFKITTLDASAYRQRAAKTIHNNLGIKNIEYVSGLFTDTLKGVLDNNKKWDLVFIDGHHQYQPTLDYFDMIYPYCNKNAVIIFDDIIWSVGMRRAWDELKVDTRFAYCVDLYKVGVAILGENTGSKPKTYNVYQEETVKLF